MSNEQEFNWLVTLGNVSDVSITNDLSTWFGEII